MQGSGRRFRGGRALRTSGSVGLTIIALLLGAGAHKGTPAGVESHTLTTERPYLIPVDGANVTITPLLTTGDTLGDYMMAGTPDGLGAVMQGNKGVVFMNHELKPGRVSRLVLDPATMAIKSGTYILSGTEGYWWLCSASMAGPEVGFDPPVFLTGEESVEGPHGGVSLAINTLDGTIFELPWLGHIRHENQVVIPGFEGKTVVITTDDDSQGSELYMYVADNPAAVLAGQGQLYVFRAHSADGTADIAKGTVLGGTFIPVEQEDNIDAKTLQQKVWEDGAFRFVRLEDVTYDRTTPGKIYFTDTGSIEQPNLTADGTPLSKNGRLYTLTLDPVDPTKVSAFTVLLDGDAGDDIRNPDNIDGDASTLMIQEDLDEYNRLENSSETGRILAFDIASGTLEPIARIDQSPGEGLVDPADEAGTWESSGILNVADIFGEGSWLATVQAHTLRVPQFGGENEGGQLLLMRVGSAPQPFTAIARHLSGDSCCRAQTSER